MKIQQTWQLQPNTQVAGKRISGSIGDVSIEVNGASLYAPFQGRLQPTGNTCALFSSPELPAYLLRLCDARNMRWGDVQAGDVIGSADTLQFATLRKQPDGTWAIVEPSRQILEKILTPQ